MKSQSLHNSTKNGFMIVYSDVTAFHEVPLPTPPPPPPPPPSTLVFRHATS